MFTTMTSRVIGDLHVKRLRQFTRFSCASEHIYKRRDISTVKDVCDKLKRQYVPSQTSPYE